MALLNATALDAVIQEPPIVAELRAIFASLNDTPLLTALLGPTRRGPKGHPVQILWRCFVAKYRLGLPSTEALIRELQNNPYIAWTCGIAWPNGIPHHSTFSRFFRRLSLLKFQHLVKDVSRDLVRRSYAALPGFGKRVALDSTTLKAWSNGGKRTPSDKDATWSVKNNTHGKNEYTLGYKLHLLVDCEYELPISANVSTGKIHDSQRATNVLSEARFTYASFNPEYLMADKGYSSQPLIMRIKYQYSAQPIIEINKGHKRMLRMWGDRQQEPEFKALFRQRTAVERVFSRLKGIVALNKITVRRRMKVTTHCYLSLIAMQARALIGHSSGKDKNYHQPLVQTIVGPLR